jgi:AraC-like DNA-binding protein
VSVEFRADQLPIESRLEWWGQLLDTALVPLEHRFDHGPEFDCRIVTGEIGPIRVADSITGPGVSARTPRLIRRSDPELYMISVLTRGEMLVEQDDRQARVTPGDLAFFDPSRPARRVHSAMHVITVSVPKAMLPFEQDELAKLTGARIPGDRGVVAVASALTRQLADSLDEVSAGEAAQLGTSAVDVLSVAVASRLDRAGAVTPQVRQEALLHRCYAFIEEQLSDPELSPTRVAAAAHVSLRYLYKMFEDQPATVSGWIRQRRLERCRRDLLDPALAARAVSAIAARWGLLNSAHFSRAFREAYGLPPAEFRSQHTASADSS